MLPKILWIIAGLLGGWVTNEILFILLNTPNQGVSVTRAFIPAMGACFIYIFCGYMAFRKTKSKPKQEVIPERNIESKNTEKENKIWEQVGDEFNSNRNKGLWAKCFAESNGDESKAKATYLRIRFNEITLKNPLSQITNKEKQQLKENENNVIAIYILAFILLMSTLLLLSIFNII